MITSTNTNDLSKKTDEAACQKWERTLSSHYQDFMLTLNIAGAKNKDYRYRLHRASAIERARSAAEATLIASRDGLSEDAVRNMAEDLHAALCGITAAGISTERIKDVGIQLLQTIVYERPFPYSASATAAEEFNKAPERVLYRADSFTTTGIQPQEFLLAPIFPLGVAGVLFGPGGVGKSLLALQLCLSVAKRAVAASQTPASIPDPLGYHVPAESGGASLFITLEDGADEIGRRLASLDPDNTREGVPCFVIAALSEKGFDPLLMKRAGTGAALTAFAEGGLERIIDRFEKQCGHPMRLIVMDPAGDLMQGDENSSDIVKPLMARMREIGHRLGCTIILVGHVAKAIDRDNPTMRGSSAWIANSRFAYSLVPVDAKEGPKLQKKVCIPWQQLVWGCLVKANHKGAPVNISTLLHRCPDTGRLLNVHHLIEPEAAIPEGAMVDRLALACERQAATGDAFTLTKARGLYERRTLLPTPLASLSRARLRKLADLAMSSGKLAKASDGGLVPPGAVSNRTV